MLRGRYRWVICALLFVATTINYIDRQVIGLLKPDLQQQFAWTRARLRRDRLHVPARLRHRPAPRRPGDGQAGDEEGLHDRHRAVERRGRRPRLRRLRPLAAVSRRSTSTRRPASRSSRSAAPPPASRSRASCSASARPATSRPRSRPSPSGSRARSAPSPPASSTPAPTSARWSRRSSCRRWSRCVGLGGRLRRHRPARLLLADLVAGPATARRRSTRRSRPRSWRCIRAIRRSRRRRCRGPLDRRYRQTWAFALGKFLTDPVWWLYLFWIPDFLNRQLRPRTSSRSGCRSS